MGFVDLAAMSSERRREGRDNETDKLCCWFIEEDLTDGEGRGRRGERTEKEDIKDEQGRTKEFQEEEE